MAKTKRELDKDLMFQKIMPAIADNPFSTVYNANHPGEAATPEQKSDHDAFQNLRNKVFSSTYMCDPGTEISVINIMENLVLGGMFLCRYYPREELSRVTKETAAELCKALNMTLLDTNIRHSTVISNAMTALQEDIIEYAPRNAVVKDYIALVDELFESGIL